MIKVNFRFEVSILICKSFIHVLIHFPWTFEELNLYELLAKTTGARLNSLAHRNVFHKWKISYINQVECAIAKTIISSSQEKQQNNSRGISTWSENIWFMCYVWVSFRCKWNINTIQRFDNSDCWRQTNKIKSIGVLNSTASTHSRRSISTYVDRRKIDCYFRSEISTHVSFIHTFKSSTNIGGGNCEVAIHCWYLPIAILRLKYLPSKTEGMKTWCCVMKQTISSLLIKTAESKTFLFCSISDRENC